MRKRYFFITFILILFISTLVLVGVAEVIPIEAPQNLSVHQKIDDDGNAFILLAFDAPESVKLFGEKTWVTNAELYYEVEYRMGRGDWVPIGGIHFSEGEQIVINDSENKIDIKNNLYSFRARFGYYTYNEDNSVVSDYSLYSNIAHIGDKTTFGSYQNASSWAVAELERALEYGFITEKIRNSMNAPISREELCEVIIALYENLAGEAIWKDANIFTDTKNPEVNKAFELGIVTGIGNNRFDPYAHTNREQVATMIFRAVKALQPEVLLLAGTGESFTDEKEISAWALEPVRFMSKSGLLKGSNGKMDPKGVTTREQAVLFAARAYEMFILQSHSYIEGNTEWENGRKILLYNQE